MFRKISLSDKPWIDRCRLSGENDMTVLSFPAVYTWQDAFGLSIDGRENFYVIKSEEDQGFYYPVGESSCCREYILSLMDSDAHVKLVYVPEAELSWLESLGFDITCNPDTSEYIYSSRSLALLDNGAGTNFRVKVRHFSRDNVWNAKELSFPDDTALLREKVSEWDRVSGQILPEDRSAVLACAREPAQIGLSGIFIETDQKEWSFLLGYESTPLIYNMSIVKYSEAMSRNAVPVCICEMAKRVCGTFPLINLEDDMGIEGLRNMKRLYHPLRLLNSYNAYR